MRIWTVLAGPVSCGTCHAVIPAETPFEAWDEAGDLRRIRCAAHAFTARDEAQIAAARQGLVARALAAEPQPERTPITRPPRVARPGGFRPIAEVAGRLFDHQKAAAGDRD